MKKWVKKIGKQFCGKNQVDKLDVQLGGQIEWKNELKTGCKSQVENIGGKLDGKWGRQVGWTK